MSSTSMRGSRRIAIADLTHDERDALLARDVSAALAFTDRKGHPRIVPCWFLWDDGSFYVSSLADKFRVRKSLTRDPRASLCVEVEEVEHTRGRRNRQVKAVGEIEILPDLQGTWTRRIRERYLRAADMPDIELGPAPRVILKLTPSRLTAHGGNIEAPD